MNGTHPSNDSLRGAIGVLPAEQRRLIEQLFWEERTETEVADAMGCQSIHNQPPQAGDSEWSSLEAGRPQRISKIFCIKILFAAI
jgi:hypothetical protein